MDSEAQHDKHQEKRRRMEVVPDNVKQRGPVLFRLISSSQLLYPLLLEPKPPPLPITREPGCEDNANQAKTRRKQAKAAAVDAPWLLRESQKHIPQSSSNIWEVAIVKMPLPIPTPAIMVLQKDQQFRKTRPPVPASRLSQYPYVEHGPLPSMVAVTNIPDCPVVQIDSPKSSISKNEKRRRRKKVTKSMQVRPPPSFWRPNPAHGGKSLGYAMGYPCSLSLPPSRSQTQYPRDTMRKGIHIDSVLQTKLGYEIT
ncbi:hypothetical protein BDZ94DRAFT_172121 [Collybia nuda]|uniref:Uncharacterized protein n=1 Tax=Collybia nuda TaxID=64659 RepID=A0A9P5YCY8_9AGAR|nr:hypothetical protein BDZ94DRAFT_172121 [Collybia nuda]